MFFLLFPSSFFFPSNPITEAPLHILFIPSSSLFLLFQKTNRARVNKVFEFPAFQKEVMGHLWWVFRDKE